MEHVFCFVSIIDYQTINIPFLGCRWEFLLLFTEALLGGFFRSPYWISNVSKSPISEGSHVAVRISPKATAIDIDKFFCCDHTCIDQYSRHMQNEYLMILKVQRQQCSASLAVVHGHWSASRCFTPLYQLYRYVRSQRGMVFRLCWS